MAYGWTEHVGELELWVEAADEGGIFSEALRALADVLGDGPPSGALERRDVVAEGADRAVLLAGWLEELNFLAETEGFEPETAEDLRLEPRRVSARVAGRVTSPPHLVKAVTYHRLAFERSGEGWRAIAVLDV